MGGGAIRVLVVDDSAIMRKELREILLQLGHEVVGEAADGYEAVKRYKELRPDLVTLDIVLPRLDGIGTLRLLKTVDPKARVVMVSSMTSKKKVLECVKLGAEQYIVKPYDMKKVKEVLEELLSE